MTRAHEIAAARVVSRANVRRYCERIIFTGLLAKISHPIRRPSNAEVDWAGEILRKYMDREVAGLDLPDLPWQAEDGHSIEIVRFGYAKNLPPLAPSLNPLWSGNGTPSKHLHPALRNKIREARKAPGATDSFIARAFNVHRRTVRRIRTGKRCRN